MGYLNNLRGLDRVRSTNIRSFKSCYHKEVRDELRTKCEDHAPHRDDPEHDQHQAPPTRESFQKALGIKQSRGSLKDKVIALLHNSDVVLLLRFTLNCQSLRNLSLQFSPSGEARYPAGLFHRDSCQRTLDTDHQAGERIHRDLGVLNLREMHFGFFYEDR